MPNIFGKEQHQYTHLMDAKEKKLLDGHNKALARRGRVHDFQALNNPLKAKLNDTESAAQALSYVTNNQQAIMAEMEEILYTEFRLPGVLPLKTSGIPEGAKSFSYRVVNRYGKGKFIDNDGKTAPSATVSQGLVPYTLEYAGIVPEWSIEDARAAAFGGLALDTETIEAQTAQRSHQTHQQRPLPTCQPLRWSSSSRTVLLRESLIPRKFLAATLRLN
jgi:hypothetical protein